jgi:Zn-dependent peptidase ImmA (M78 family)
MMQIKDILGMVRHFRSSIPVDVEGLSLSLGIPVYKNPLPANVSGMIHKTGAEKYAIYVNEAHPETRQRFTIAHELGHFVLHRIILGEGTVDDCAYRSDGSIKNSKIGKFHETEANKFAANLLMPPEKIDEARKEAPAAPPIALAKKFNVSEGAMKIRLGVK